MTIRENARSMRRVPTKSEARIWSWLRNRKFGGHKFRRQHPVAGFILDFYCPQLKLAIEADGRQHDEPGAREYDDARTLKLRALGISVLRIPNEMLAWDPEDAAEWIRTAVEQRT